jgi:hypothetical protein
MVHAPKIRTPLFKWKKIGKSITVQAPYSKNSKFQDRNTKFTKKQLPRSPRSRAEYQEYSFQEAKREFQKILKTFLKKMGSG